MSTIQVTSEVSFDQLLHGVEQLSDGDLEKLNAHVLAVQAQRRAPHLPEKEAALLLTINQGLTQEEQARFDQLTTKRQAEMLSPEEHAELLQWIDRIEHQDAERIAALASLARLRNTTLRELMQKLGIRRPEYA
jgi:hypothetical protein